MANLTSDDIGSRWVHKRSTLRFTDHVVEWTLQTITQRGPREMATMVSNTSGCLRTLPTENLVRMYNRVG